VHAVDSAAIAMPDKILPVIISSQVCRVTGTALRGASLCPERRDAIACTYSIEYS
jgi:hypothetical protein